jgi:hypothetical protein
LLYVVGITPDRAKIENSNTVKFTNGDGETIETIRPTATIRIRETN